MIKPKSNFLYGIITCVIYLVSLKVLKNLNMELYNNVLYIGLAIILAPYAYKLFEKLKII